MHGLFQAQARGGRTVEQAREAFIKGIPLQRLASPKDIAEAVAFLTSDAAAYVTGIELTVDGVEPSHFARAHARLTNQDGEEVMGVVLEGYLPDPAARERLHQMTSEGDPSNPLRDRRS